MARKNDIKLFLFVVAFAGLCSSLVVLAATPDPLGTSSNFFEALARRILLVSADWQESKSAKLYLPF